MTDNNLDKNRIIIVYDHECPVCQHFVKGVRLRQLSEGLTLVNARDTKSVEVQYALTQNINLNDNMVVIYQQQIFAGAQAITWLAAMTTPSTILNKLLFACFRSPKLAKLLYPILRKGRLLLLRLLGRSVISEKEV